MLAAMYLYYTVLLVAVHALSIEKVSEKQNVTKRAANGDFFPDWVPFKNKHGEELGEFQQVTKAKPKKRLAPPVNFILRAVAEPEGDDYYDKGQGESDGEEYFEKKDWSDLNRPAEQVADSVKIVNHTDISDIDGVVNIITHGKPSVILNALQLLNKSKKTKEHVHNEPVSKNSEEDTVHKIKEEKEEKQQADSREDINPVKQNNKEHSKEAKKEVKKRYEDEIEYEDNDSEKPKPELNDDDQSESDAKKASILDSVDELKERHAVEQKAISEKAKEDEIDQEEHERNKIGSHERHDKYDIRGRKKESDYDEYDEKELSVHEKYKVRPSRISTTTRRSKSMGNKGKKSDEVGKMSVFKNPQLYMIYDDESEETTTTKKPSTTRTKSRGSSRFSSKFTTTTAEPEENVHISLVPQDPEAKEGEPTLFFPKTIKNKKRRKDRTTTPEPDTSAAESIANSSAQDLTTAIGATGTGSSGLGTTSVGSDTTASGTETSASGSAPSATGSDSSASARYSTAPAGDTTASGSAPSSSENITTHTGHVADTVSASTDHKHEKKQEDYHSEKGGGKEYHSEHSEEHAEHGKKAYEGVHKDSKTAKGHHDKEDHRGDYKDKGGHDKHHHEESGHYGDHHHEEHGKKHAKYEESGKHSKGHSTKGSHDIHKKEEYEKKVEFFEEEGDSAEEEKHGGYHKDREHKAGGKFKKGNLKAEHSHHDKGDSGHYQKGGHEALHKGHRQAIGYDSHGKHGHQKFHKEGGASGKKWVYHHGHPAKTANLVVIDRRADQYYHGPQYYG